MMSGGRNPRKAPNGHNRSQNHSKGKKFPKATKPSRWRYSSAIMASVLWLAALILGILMLSGCISDSGALKRLYLAELRTNDTYDVRFRVGYFGGCLSMAKDSIFNMNSTGSYDSSLTNDNSHSYCLKNLYSLDPDDVEEEFIEEFPVASDIKAHLKASLNQTLPLVRHLQKDVFHWSIPLFSVILFFIGGMLLLTLAISPNSKRVYKFWLVLALMLAAFAFALAFTSALGSKYAMKELVDISHSSISIKRGKGLSTMHETQLALVAFCYIFLGLLYIGPSTRNTRHGA
jgi:hypothetical protein